MSTKKLRKETIPDFKELLCREEKSPATVEKYLRDVENFRIFLHGKQMTKTAVISFKNFLLNKGYSPRTVNSMMVSLNHYFKLYGYKDLQMKMIRTQRDVYCPNDRELTREEYLRLLNAAKKKKSHRTYLILQTLCSTGMRVSELKQLTVDSLERGEIQVLSKGKSRRVFIVPGLCKQLEKYVKTRRIRTGPIFQTRNGNPINRSDIWKEMKALCEDSGVLPSKVYPHNLRHLFARTFYEIDNDIVRLADVLGHTSVDTTRIYLIDTGDEHRKKMEQLHLIAE